MSEESINERTKVIGEILSTKFEEIDSRALCISESGIQKTQENTRGATITMKEKKTGKKN